MGLRTKCSECGGRFDSVFNATPDPDSAPVCFNCGPLASSVALLLDAVDGAIETFPGGHENAGAYIVAFSEYERLDALDNAAKLVRTLRRGVLP